LTEIDQEDLLERRGGACKIVALDDEKAFMVDRWFYRSALSNR